MKGKITSPETVHKNASKEIMEKQKNTSFKKAAPLKDKDTLDLLEQREAELALINTVQEGIATGMDLQRIYNLVGDRIRDLFDSEVVAICIFDLERNLMDYQYVYEDGKNHTLESSPIDTLRRYLIDTGDLICINESVDEKLIELMGEAPPAVKGTLEPKSVLYVPMKTSEAVRGFISLQNLSRENAFQESDVRLLSTLVNSMSVALENARLFNETEQRNAELAVINSVQQGLVAEMDMQGIYDLVGERIRNLFDAQVTVIATLNLDTKTEEFHYAFEDGKRHYPGPRLYNKLRQKLIESKELISINKDASKAANLVPGTKEPKSMVFVPLIIGDSVNGYVSLQNIDKENAFDDSDVRLLSTLANSMSVALENARLFNETTRLLSETEQRNAELAVINSVQEGLVREMDMQAIYKLVGDRICNVLNTQTLMIRTFNLEEGLENWEYVVENGERFFSTNRPLNWANQHLIKTKEPIFINKDYVRTAEKFGGKGVSKGLPPKSAIFVPMMVSNTVTGSVSLQNVIKENAFTESDLQLLTTLTNSMSVALENARLFNETTRLLAETEQRATEMLTVNNISRALVSQLEFDALMNLVGEQMRDTFKADIVYLAIHDKKTDMLHFPYSYGDVAESRRFGNGITEKIISTQEPLLINQNLNDAYDKIRAEKKGKMVESYLGVPIIYGKKAIGVISVQSTEQENRFNENDLRLLTTIAANVGVAMQNAEAYEKLQAALSELKSAQTQLVQQEKMASLGQLTAGIAHEIKNPLNFVNNFSEVSKELLDEMNEELKNGNYELVAEIAEDVNQNLEKILHHGKRADGIVKGMLQHSRTNSGQKEEVSINSFVDEYLKLAFHGLRAKDKSFNAGMETDFDPTAGKIPAVPQELGRVVLNLVTNAFYAVNEKKTLRQAQGTVRQVKDDNSYEPTVWVSTHKKNEVIEIKVRDNGMGIPEEIKDKIFQPFFTTKPTGEGTGLGLSLSYDIIKSHGGELCLHTGTREGSTFIISLPKG